MIDTVGDGKYVVRDLVNRYLDGLFEYAVFLQQVCGLNDHELRGVLKMAINTKLSQLSKTWKKVAPVSPSFTAIADGDYIGDLKEMKLEEAKKSGRLQVVSTYEIADGEYEGKAVKRFDGLDNETSMGYFKGYCEIIGLELPDDLEMLQEAMDDFVENNTDLFNVTVKSSKGEGDKTYQNVYVNGISEYTKTEGEGEEVQEEEQTEEVAEEQVEEVAEEQVEEEQVEEEQEVQAPIKKFSAKKAAVPTKPVTQTNGKTVAKPLAKPVAGVKKIVAKR